MRLIRKNKKLIISALALVQIVLIIAMSSYAWLEMENKSAVTSSKNFELNADSGVKINFNGIDYDNSIVLNNMKLWQASSIDGRNIFFPTVGLKNASSNESTQTSNAKYNTTLDMRFRKGNASDVNSKYIVRDFTMWADAGECDVWIDATKTAVLRSGGSIASEIRVAFYENKGEDPIVFTPEIKSNYPGCITGIDSSGAATIAVPSNLKTFANFSAGSDEPLFHLEQGEVKKITMIVWLEGTDPSCTSNNIKNGDTFSLAISFGSSAPKANRYFFVDQTPNKWITANYNNYSDHKMYAIDATGEDPTEYRMVYASENSWVAAVPETVTKIKFVVVAEGYSVTWNSGENLWLQNSQGTYYATYSVYGDPLGGYGYWAGDPGAKTNTLYFTMNSAWGDSWNDYNVYPKIFLWSNNYKYTPYPGYNMTWVADTDGDERIFKFEVPAGVTGVTISKSNDENAKIDISGSDLAGISGTWNGFYPTGGGNYGMYQR